MLNLIYGNRVERLAEALLDRLAEPGGDPLAGDWVVVAHAAMGRWLSRRKAARDGICANVEFLYPAGAMWRLLRVANPTLPADNPFRPEALSLRLLDSFEPLSREPGLEPLAHALSGHDDLGRFRLARRLAALYDQYLVFRPDWILAWEQGSTPHWQAGLWCRLVDPGQWHWARCWQWLRARETLRIEAPGWPKRLSLFAIPELAPSYLDCLARLATATEIDVYQFSPSRQYWGDATSPRARTGAPAADGNPLLPSLAPSLRDQLDWLLEWPASEREDFRPSAGDGLLAHLQNDLLDYTAPAAPAAVAEAGIEIHVCASRRREVEVCHDRLLALFEADPSLRADEIVVVSPDIGAYLPYVRALFTRIPWHLLGAAAPRGKGAVPAVLALLQALATEQPDRSLLELLSFPVIRRRFALRAADLADARRWIREGGLFGVDDGKFSWSEGAARLLAATLLGRRIDDWPAAERVHGSEAERIGRLLEFLDALLAAHAGARRSRPPAEWVGWGQALLARFIEPSPADEAQLRSVRQALWRISVLASDCTRAVDFAVLRELLSAAVGTAAAEVGGAGGGVAFAAHSAVRLIPARVVYALGLNEGEFPAPLARSDVDLIAAAPRRGDRSRRQEDRQVFLEWLGSARERLLLSYVGTDARDGAALAPSPLMVEFLDHLDRHYRFADAREAEEPSGRIVTRHPVQPFSARYGNEPGLISYADHLRADPAGAAPRPFQAGPLPVADEAGLDVAELVEFLRAPARHYLRHRLGIWLDLPEDLLPLDPPVELDPLGRYRLIEALLGERTSDPEALCARAATAVEVPEGPPGAALAAALVDDLEHLRGRLSHLGADVPGRELLVDRELGGVRLGGRVGGVFDAGRVVVHAGVPRGKHLIALWVNHLLLNLLARNGTDRSSRLIAGRGEAKFQPVAEPAPLLEGLIALYREGERCALPFFPDTSRAFAERAGDRRKARREALRVFTPDRRQPFAEGADPYVKLAFRDRDWRSERFEALAIEVWGPLLEHLEERTHG